MRRWRTILHPKALCQQQIAKESETENVTRQACCRSSAESKSARSANKNFLQG